MGGKPRARVLDALPGTGEPPVPLEWGVDSRTWEPGNGGPAPSPNPLGEREGTLGGIRSRGGGQNPGKSPVLGAGAGEKPLYKGIAVIPWGPQVQNLV